MLAFNESSTVSVPELAFTSTPVPASIVRVSVVELATQEAPLETPPPTLDVETVSNKS